MVNTFYFNVAVSGHVQFPGIIGAIDRTHIAIVSPNIQEHLYINRKLYHSLNVLIVCIILSV